MNQKNREKYLSRTGFLPDFWVDQSYEFYVVIPVRREQELFPESLNSLLKSGSDFGDGKIAYVIVINSDPEETSICEENLFVEAFCNLIPHVFIIDRFREKRLLAGVGEARRLGMDHVVSWCSSNSWIVSLDADTIVASNFFKAINAMPDKVVLAPFQHRDRSAAVEEYEAWLRYFCAGLKYAKSPYAYVPLGCRFSVRLQTYIESGGMVKRTAGEDFHFLQKLTKILMPNPFGTAATCVYPSGRISDRVPWGTGPAINDINNQEKRFTEVQPFNAFHEVKLLLELVEDLYTTDIELSEEMHTFLTNEKYQVVVEKFRNNSKTNVQFSRLFHQWFDGLRTIRFINTYTRLHGKEDLQLAQSRFSFKVA